MLFHTLCIAAYSPLLEQRVISLCKGAIIPESPLYFISEMHKFAKFGTAYSSMLSRIVVVVLLLFFCFVCLVLSCHLKKN